MSKMFQLVDELRQQLHTIGDTEQKLVSSLREALDRFDQKLLHDVRSLTAEHEARRGAILTELQGLASRMGAFPSARDARLGLGDGPGETAREGPPALPPNGPPNGPSNGPPSLSPSGKLRAVPGGAWREATEQLQSELDVYFRKRA